MDLMQRLSAASDQMQGVPRDGGERVTAFEVGATQTGAVSRLQRLARITGLMAHQDIARIIASQTQQYMSRPTMAKVLGRMDYVLQKLYGDQEYISVNPEDIDCNFDVVPVDNMTGRGDNPAGWGEILKTMLANPLMQQEIAQRFDTVRWMKNVCRLMGMKNVDEFERTAPPVQATVVPDEAIAGMQQAGQIAPIGGPGAPV
jgi:hypothetical protein